MVVNDYDKQSGAAKTHGDTTYLTVTINKDKAVNEIIDGFDAESVPGNLVADRLDSAGYSLALQIDSDGSAELTTAGTALEDTTALTEKTIYANIVDARTKQSVENVPTEGRWLLVSPETYGLLLKSPEFIKASDLGDADVRPALLAGSQATLCLRTPPWARMWSTSPDTPTGLHVSRSGRCRSMCRIWLAPVSISAPWPYRAAKSTPTRSPRPRPFW